MKQQELVRRTSAWVLGVVAALVVMSSVRPPHAEESTILAAMQDELKRSMKDLRLKDEPAPYYIDYDVEDVSTMRVVSRLGALLDDELSRTRTLQVDVRVGDYTFDSSR